MNRDELAELVAAGESVTPEWPRGRRGAKTPRRKEEGFLCDSPSPRLCVKFLPRPTKARR